MKPHLVISDKHIGAAYPCLIIAEVGVNHNGNMALARQLIAAAAQSGADAVKFQTFTAERLVSRDAPKAAYQKTVTDTDESQYEMLRKLELPPSAYIELMSCCADNGILFLSTPFEEESADFLETLGVPAFKLPSGEITNTPFLAYVARKGKPMIVSTGMSTLDEVDEAVACIRAAGSEQLALLHCVSNYPADPADCNLRAIDTLRERFKIPTGFSDHTAGIQIAIAAVARGANIIEKHFTLDRELPGPDHKASLTSPELAAMVRAIRLVESSLGDGVKCRRVSEYNTADVARKSIVAGRDIAAGEILSRENLAIMRPSGGVPPSRLDDVIGKRILRALKRGELFHTKDFA